MKLRSKWLLGTFVGLISLYLAACLILPDILRGRAVNWVANNTARTLQIEKILLNPITLSIRVAGFELSETGSEDTFIAFERLKLKPDLWRSLAQGAVVLKELSLDQPRLRIARDETGGFNYDDLLIQTSEKDSDESTSAPMLFAISNVRISNGRADFSDTQLTELNHTVRDFNLALPFVGNTAGLVEDFITPQLDFVLDGAPMVAKGDVKPFADRLEANLHLDLSNIDIPYYSPYLPRERPFSIDSGKLALLLDISYWVTGRGEVKVSLGGQASLTGLRFLDSIGEVLFFLPMVRVDLDRLDPLLRHASVNEVTIYGAEIFVSRDQQGAWNHARLAPPERGEVSAPTAQRLSSETPHLTLKKLRVHDAMVHYRDLSGRADFRKEVHNINLELDDFSSRGGSAPFKLDAIVTERLGTPSGEVKATGQISVSPFALEARLLTNRLLLSGLENFLPAETSLRVDGGHVDSDLLLELDAGSGSLQGELTGEVGLRALQLSEPQTGTEVLSWESLQLDRLSLQLTPDPVQLRIGEVALNNYQARIVVTRDGEVNLQQVRQPQEKVAAEEEPPEVSLDDTPPFKMRIDEMVLQGGELSFRDEHLPQPFTSTFYELGGRISGLSSEEGGLANLDLRGSLENHSPLRLTGALQPLVGPLFLEIESRLETMELTPLTGYAETYLGYPITKGKLYLNLDYRIEGEQIKASNQVFLDQFTLGARQPSDKATKLPVKLAIALLKDVDGEIHLDLPVEGDLSSPEFSVVGVVMRILKNLLIKAATSPLALLSALVGGGEDFSTIDFALGQSHLTPEEEKKLVALNEALRKRPGLKLEVRGHVDRENDPEAWRRSQLELQLKKLKFGRLPRAKQNELGEPSRVIVADEELSDYLQQAYRKADFPKPRNVFGFAKTLSDAEAEKLMLANIVAGDAEMNELARQRALKVRNYLVESVNMPPERVFMNMEHIDDAPDKGKLAHRVSFGVATD